MKNNLPKILAAQLVLTLIVSLFWAKDSSHHEFWFVFFGALVSGSQFGLLYIIWWRIFTKKNIAPTVIAVVIKYALLGLSFWYLSPLHMDQIKALTAGVLTNPVTLILIAGFIRPSRS